MAFERHGVSLVANCSRIERVIVFVKTDALDSDANAAAHMQHHDAETAAALGNASGAGAPRVAVLLAELR